MKNMTTSHFLCPFAVFVCNAMNMVILNQTRQKNLHEKYDNLSFSISHFCVCMQCNEYGYLKSVAVEQISLGGGGYLFSSDDFIGDLSLESTCWTNSEMFFSKSSTLLPMSSRRPMICSDICWNFCCYSNI